MSVQLINLVVLVAIINGVYSNKEFRIAVVSNVDTVHNNLHSFFQGSLTYDSSSQEVKVKLVSSQNSESSPDSNNENILLLSGPELTHCDGKLYAAVNKKGQIYLYQGGKFELWTIVPSDRTKNFVMPISWATALGKVLYVGPNGNEEVNYVAEIQEDKNMNLNDFTKQFDALKNAAGVANGYMTHESCVYSEKHNEFYFLPKKASPTIYSKKADLNNAANILLSMDKDMSLFNKVAEIQHSIEYKDRGYSSFAFLPGTEDEVIVALQTSDVTNSTYITAFTRQGKVVLQSMQIFEGQLKGLAFLLTSKTEG